MIQLASTYRKHGYDFKLILRRDDVAVFSQIADNKLYGYEVFIVQKNEESERFGKTFPASESVPPSSAWGKEAFTCRTIGDAFKRAEDLRVREISRLNRKLV